MRLNLYQVDVFTRVVFGGNPAAVVPLEEWPEDRTLQAIAEENNLAETAFLAARDGGYDLRWFTPRLEVPLCGHATLASAFVVFTVLDPGRTTVEFATRSGSLRVHRAPNDLLAMDLPKRVPAACEPPPTLLEALGRIPARVLRTDEDPNYFAVFDSEEEIRTMAPDLARLADLHPHGTVVTAPGTDVDFVSRYFAPSYGIPEDPATGSIHCGLVPFWAERLGRSRLHARQLSQRGGELHCQERTTRVLLAGGAVLYMEGEIRV